MAHTHCFSNNSISSVKLFGRCKPSSSPSPFAFAPSTFTSSSNTHTSLLLLRVNPTPPPRVRILRVLTEETQLDQDTFGGDDGFGSGVNGGGGGGGGDGDWNKGEEEEGGDSNDKKKKSNSGMSMSQKLTLAYAALVGVGGVMGYIKGGSQKSLAAGGLSALLLYYVYTQLPVRPAFASSLGLGLSAALLGVMGSRFKKSGKVFPAGIVSFVSLVMTGGYLHGIMRNLHA